MRKIVLSAVLWSLFLTTGNTATDPKTVEFLQKVDQYYYCLSREGLKGFSGEFGVDITEAFKDFIRQKRGSTEAEKEFRAMSELRFKISASVAGKVLVQLVPIQPSADPKFDQWVIGFADEMKKTLEGVFEFWNGMVLTPIFGQEDFDQAVLRVQNTADGFTVLMTKKTGTDSVIFDRQARITGMTSVENGVTTATIKPDYIPSQKGFVLAGAVISIPARSIQCTFQFQVVDRYWMPKTISVIVSEGVNYVKGEGFVFNLFKTQLQP